MKNCFFLVLFIVGAFSGYAEILSGRIRFINEGEPGEYFVAINEDIRISPREIEVTPATEIQVRIYQTRLFSSPVFYNGKVKVDSGSTLNIRFTIPFLISEEKEFIEKREQAISFLEIKNPFSGEVKKELSTLIRVFSDTPFCPELQIYAKFYQEKLNRILAEERKLQTSTVAIADSEAVLYDFNGKAFFYTGISFSAMWYPVEGTYATVFGGGLNSGFSVPVKAFASVGYFISGIFEPSLFTFGGGLTPSFAFHFGENKEFSFGISPLEGFVRIDYRSHPVVTKFGLNASVQFDFKNAYCRISGGGTFDREPVMILSAGFRWDFPVSARRMI